MMSGPAPSARTLGMVEAYQAGATLAEVAAMFGVREQRVHAAVKRHAPEAMRLPHVKTFPSAGPPGAEIYAVGDCKKCGVRLLSYRPEAYELCGHCERASG